LALPAASLRRLAVPTGEPKTSVGTKNPEEGFAAAPAGVGFAVMQPCTSATAIATQKVVATPRHPRNLNQDTMINFNILTPKLV